VYKFNTFSNTTRTVIRYNTGNYWKNIPSNNCGYSRRQALYFRLEIDSYIVRINIVSKGENTFVGPMSHL
jgi:phenylacetate-coenzyme A ligase PaaK-like adenylate-forming protein